MNLWRRLYYNSYIDPDGYPLDVNSYKQRRKIRCTSDGLLSIKRIKEKEGFGQEFIDAFKTYRKTPIFFFPSENKGINTSRSKFLEDRIDHTLFDIKCYCEGKHCILEEAYKQQKTKAWLGSFGEKKFEELVNWLGIKGIFVDDNYEVFDLEKNDGSTLNEIKPKEEYVSPRSGDYLKAWSNEYYENVKGKIGEFMKPCK